MATLVQTIAQMTKFTSENKIRMGISLASLLVNFFAALWTFSLPNDIQQNHWKVVVFNIVFIITGILPPYSAFSMLVPHWLTWYGFAIICCVVTFVKGYNILEIMYTCSSQKVNVATKYVIEKFTLLNKTRQLPIDDSVL